MGRQAHTGDGRDSASASAPQGRAELVCRRNLRKVQGRWCYLYRAIDTSGALVDVRLSETRDMAAAKAFFQSAKTVTGITPARVTTDGHDSYPRAIRLNSAKLCAIGPTNI